MNLFEAWSLKKRCGQLAFNLQEPQGLWRCTCSCGKSIMDKSNRCTSTEWDKEAATFRAKHKGV